MRQTVTARTEVEKQADRATLPEISRDLVVSTEIEFMNMTGSATSALGGHCYEELTLNDPGGCGDGGAQIHGNNNS